MNCLMDAAIGLFCCRKVLFGGTKITNEWLVISEPIIYMAIHYTGSSPVYLAVHRMSPVRRISWSALSSPAGVTWWQSPQTGTEQATGRHCTGWCQATQVHSVHGGGKCGNKEGGSLIFFLTSKLLIKELDLPVGARKIGQLWTEPHFWQHAAHH